MNGLAIESGKIIYDKKEGVRYRIIAIAEDDVILCHMDTSKLKLTSFLYEAIMKSVNDGSMGIESDEDVPFNIDDLSDEMRHLFENKRNMMDEVDAAFGPTYLGLNVGKRKDQSDQIRKAEEIWKKYGISYSSFRRICREYLQNGMRDSSLVDGRYFSEAGLEPYHYTHKPGRRPEHFEEVGIALTDVDRANMDKGVEHTEMLGGSTVRNAYIWMTMKFYSRKDLPEDSLEPSVLPESERPTYRQFEYYLETHKNE